MDKVPAVKVTNVRKEFILPQHRNSSLKQAVVNIRKKNGKVTQTVLNGISFEVQKGDFFGIVGRNGSGKSTLLKILAGVYTPTEGGVEMNGKLTPFIELGVGFNPELSGRDNVYLNGALLGYDRTEMDAMYDEIVEFAELEPFMDQKLKNYSSGMQVRLAFSIAIKAKNDILIFDEVLAVGDEAFQRKCFDVFERYKAEKQTVILVTHDMESVRKFCNRAMLISDGNIVEIGDPRSVANRYSELNQESIDKEVEKENQTTEGEGPAQPVKPKFLKARMLTADMRPTQSFKVGEAAVVELAWLGLEASRIESIGVHILKQSGEHITGINSRASEHSPDWKHKGNIALEFKLDLIPGKYQIMVEAFSRPGVAVDSLLQGPKFSVKNQEMTWSGLVELRHRWRE